MSPDIAIVFNALVSTLARAGHNVADPETRKRIGSLAFGLVMDVRFQRRRRGAAPEMLASLDRLRPEMQAMTRSCAASLGLVDWSTTHAVPPADAAGEDVELWGLIPDLDRLALEAMVDAVLWFAPQENGDDYAEKENNG